MRAVVDATRTAGALLLFGCSGPEPGFSAPHEYALRGTSVVSAGPAGATCGVSNDDEGPLSLQQPPRALDEMTVFVEVNGSGDFSATDSGGCRIAVQANDELNRLSTRNASCSLDEDSTLSYLGVTAGTYRRFQLDFVTNRWFQVLTTQQVDGAGVSYESCAVGEGWIGDSAAPDRPTSATSGRLRYSGTYAWFAERPEDGTVCDVEQGEWDTAGYLLLEATSEGGLEVYEEGVGCSFAAQSNDGVSFAAEGVGCDWSGPVSLRDIDVVERSFDSWHYDSETGEVTAKGRQVRATDDGERLLSCFSLELLVDGAAAAP